MDQTCLRQCALLGQQNRKWRQLKEVAPENSQRFRLTIGTHRIEIFRRNAKRAKAFKMSVDIERLIQLTIGVE